MLQRAIDARERPPCPHLRDTVWFGDDPAPARLVSTCQKWYFPADTVLGLEDRAGYSPSVQEMAALTVSKRPVAEASALLERLTGVKVAPSSLAREAQRQGEREQLDAQMQTNAGCARQQRELQMDLPLKPFTLVIELDAWNIRERTDWGRSDELRATGTELSRWH